MMRFRNLALALGLMVMPTVASAGPILVNGGTWSTTVAPSGSGDPTALASLGFLPFWANDSWDGKDLHVGFLLDTYNKPEIEYLHNGVGGFTSFRFDDALFGMNRINGLTAWTNGQFGIRADGAFTYDSGTGRKSNSWDNPEQYALFRIVLPEVTHYFVGIEDILLSEKYNDRDYNDYVAAFSQPNPVPEPGTLLLLGSGAAAMALRRRAAKRREQTTA
jgi:hypothetical protein